MLFIAHVVCHSGYKKALLWSALIIMVIMVETIELPLD